MSVLRHIFLPERAHWFPALLAAAGIVCLIALWVLTGSSWFGVALWPFVWISFTHLGLRLERGKTKISVTRTMLLMLMLAPALSCGDDEVPETMEQCFEQARKTYWTCHTSWMNREQGCLNDFTGDEATCEILFPFPTAPAKR